MQSPIWSIFDFTPPNSALVMNCKIEPFLYDPATQPDLPEDGFMQTRALLKDIALVLTVVGPRVTISAAEWFIFDDKDLELASIFSGSQHRQGHEILPIRSKDYPILCPEEAKQIVQSYLKLQGKTRDKVRVALQRLNQSLRRHNIGDQAVELSIAFETLLGDDGNAEMTHKIKVRSIRLIGGVAEIRKKNAAVINEAYSIRSKLVHTGHVETSKKKKICGNEMSVFDIIDHTIVMCVDLIKIIILQGMIPDWSVYDITDQS